VSKPTEQRPPQVSLAVGLVIGASLLVLVAAWERVSTLGSLELQEGIRDGLAQPPFSGMGLDVPAVTGLIRIASMVAAAGACATAILGWYARKPDRSARLWLTVFAVPVFIGGLAVDSLSGPFVAAGVAMLWMMPAREWFATGRWTPPDPVEKDDPDRRTASRGGGAPADPWGRPPAAPPTQPPPAARPFGEPAPGPHNPYGQPYPPQGQPQGQPVQQLPPPGPYPPPHGWHPPRPAPRPQAVITAFVITLVTAGGLLALSLMALAVAATSMEPFVAELERQQPGFFDNGTSVDDLRTTMLAMSSGFVVWSAVALVLAGFAMAQREWARRGLIVSAAFSAGGCLALVVVVPPILLPGAAAIATVVLLRRADVRGWFAARAG
jgi:hypothetical protein